ncbi:MAG: hypothetical protein EPO12_08200 [Aquabacterium sp.]|jgi:hypothetical protein|nr:MAG: hypothetical protein EPO12_08200 [Aquabacterium sp.]
MSQSTVRLNPSPTKKIVVALLIAAAAAGGAAVWWSSARHAEEGKAPADGASFPWSGEAAKPANPLADMKLTPEEADRQQRAAAEAARRQVGAAELTGPVKERPEFVSQLEWAVLQQASQRAPDPSKELTRLINNLRFMKHLDEWRALAGGDAKQRQAVAAQLLATVPARVAAGEMSKADAQQLQAQLLADLVADPNERARRAEEEGRLLVEPPKPAA